MRNCSDEVGLQLRDFALPPDGPRNEITSSQQKYHHNRDGDQHKSLLGQWAGVRGRMQTGNVKGPWKLAFGGGAYGCTACTIPPPGYNLPIVIYKRPVDVFALWGLRQHPCNGRY